MTDFTFFPYSSRILLLSADCATIVEFLSLCSSSFPVFRASIVIFQAKLRYYCACPPATLILCRYSCKTVGLLAYRISPFRAQKTHNATLEPSCCWYLTSLMIASLIAVGNCEGIVGMKSPSLQSSKFCWYLLLLVCGSRVSTLVMWAWLLYCRMIMNFDRLEYVHCLFEVTIGHSPFPSYISFQRSP